MVTTDQPGHVEQLKLPPAHAAAPLPLKPGATAAFSVAEWKREAIAFQQRLDDFLSHGQPGAHEGVPPAGAEGGAPAAAAPSSAWEAALSAHEAAGPQGMLDASDLRLLTVQEELIQELGAGLQQAQQAQQAQQREQAAQQAGDTDAHPPHAAVDETQVQQQQQQGQQPPQQQQPTAQQVEVSGDLPLARLEAQSPPVQAVPSGGEHQPAGGAEPSAAAAGGRGTQQVEEQQVPREQREEHLQQMGSAQQQQQQQQEEAPAQRAQQTGEPVPPVQSAERQQALVQPRPQPVAGTVGHRRGRQQRRHAKPAPVLAAAPAGGHQGPGPGQQQQQQAEEQQQDGQEADQQGNHQQQQQEQQQQQHQPEGLPGGPATLPFSLEGLPLPWLPLPPMPAIEQVAAQQQALFGEQQVAPSGKRQRKRPKWMANMVGVGAEAQAALPAEPAPLLLAALQMPLLPMPPQPALALPALALPVPEGQAGETAEQGAASAAAVALPLPAELAPGLDWSLLTGLLSQPHGDQAVPLLPWPPLGDLLAFLPAQLQPQVELEQGEEEAAAAEEPGKRRRAAARQGDDGGGDDGTTAVQRRGKRGGRGRGRGGQSKRAGRGLSVQQIMHRAAVEVKTGADAALEAFRQRAEAARQRRMEQRRAAASLLASLADSELAAPLQWQLVQDARSRQLQMVARAAAEAALLEAAEAEAGRPADRVEGEGERQVVLQVALHVPHAPHLVSVEWLVLGSQSLTELRDRLFCVADSNVAAVEDEENAHLERNGQPLLQLRKPSAYFYIEGTFYNDLRHPEAADYSEPVRRYNSDQGIPAPPHPPPGSARSDVVTTEFSAARMEGTTFDSLWLRLGAGAGNLYCHQGGCEHLLTFQDVRLFDPTVDPPLRRHYPFRLTAPQHTMIRDCEVCGGRTAKRVTYDDRATPHTPFFWCEECFRLMHYDEQGVALYTDFRVFPYVQEYPGSVVTTRPGRMRRAAATAKDQA